MQRRGSRPTSRPTPARFLAASTAIHGLVFVVFATLATGESLPRAPVVVASTWEPPVELAPPPEPLPEPLPPPERPADEMEALDEPAPMDAAWEPVTIAVATFGGDRLAQTPRARARRHDGPSGQGLALAPAPPAAVAPPPPPVTQIEPPREPVRVAARAVSTERPGYPEEARAAGIEGTVRLEIDVDAEGAVADVRIVESSGSTLLDRAAVSAVRRWTFAPATVDGTPIGSTVRLPPIRFRLDW